MKAELITPMVLEKGKSYKLSIPNYLKPTKIHIDGVMKNPCYSPREEWIDNAEDLIVCRVWSSRGDWKWFIMSYWEICMWNDWKYKK